MNIFSRVTLSSGFLALVLLAACSDDDGGGLAREMLPPLPALSAAPGTEEAELQAFVIDAIRFAVWEENGVAALNEPGSGFLLDETYIFVLDSAGLVLASAANLDLVGQNRWELQDSDGYYHVQGYAQVADADGAWVVYRFRNPNTDIEEPKLVWLVRYDELIYGAGLYVEMERWVVGLLTQALEAYERGGDIAIEQIADTEGPFVRGSEYVFIIDTEGNRVASQSNPALVGQNALGAEDSDGIRYIQRILDRATPEGNWVAYRLVNQATGQEEPKISHVVLHEDNLVFGSGLYVAEQEWVKTILDEAIDEYDANGAETTLAEISSPDGNYQRGEIYVFVLNGEGTVLAHENPELIGQNLSGQLDSDNFAFVDYMIENADEAGSYVDYRFTHPLTGAEEKKRSWVVRHDDLIFGIGVYLD